MAALDRIPPLPTAAVQNLEMLPCPWCGEHDYYDFFNDELACKSCGRQFDLLPGGLHDDPVTQGLRSETDLKYMAAHGIDEEMVEAHHEPPDSGEAP